jgi:hypothetical protein
MRFTWTFFEILVGSVLTGFVLFWLSRRIRRKPLRVAFVVISGLVCGGIVYAVALVVLSLTVPVASDDVVTHHQVFRLDFLPGSPTLRTPTGFDMDPHVLGSSSSFEVVYSDSVKKKEDFTVSVVAESTSHALKPESYEFLLSAPESATVRTSYQCATGTPQKSQTSACASAKGTSVRASWDVSLSEPSTGNLVLTVPASIIEQLMPAPEWVAVPSYGNEVIMRSARRSPFQTWKGGDPRDDLTPFLISQKVPYMESHGGEVDLSGRQIRLRTEAVDSSGFSAATYSKLTGIGTLLSGILGTGWLWQFLTWRRQQKEKAPQNQLDERKQ